MKVVIALSVALVCAYLLLGYYVQKTFSLQISVPETSATAQSIGKQVNTITDAVHNGTIPYRKVNLTSVGLPSGEARLLELQGLLENYEVVFGRPPQDVSELRQLKDGQSLTFIQRWHIEKIARECHIFAFPQDSFLLNCDSWPVPTSESAHSLVEGFDKETEQFYVVGGHLFLYAPPPMSRKD